MKENSVDMYIYFFQFRNFATRKYIAYNNLLLYPKCQDW